MSPTLEVLREEDIIARRDELLARAGMGLDEMREADAEYRLDQDHQAVLRRLDELAYLETE